MRKRRGEERNHGDTRILEINLNYTFTMPLLVADSSLAGVPKTRHWETEKTP